MQYKFLKQLIFSIKYRKANENKEINRICISWNENIKALKIIIIEQ